MSSAAPVHKLPFTMQEKHPLETILENIIDALPTRGAIKATVKTEAMEALRKWQAGRDAEPVQAPNDELEALRTMREAVRKALTWGPPEQSSPTLSREEMDSAWKHALPRGVVMAQPVPAPRMVEARPVRPSAAIAAGIVEAARVMPTA